MTTCMVDHAQRYVERGWYIFPVWWVGDDGSCACGDTDCKNVGKHPIVQRGVWDASNEFKRVTWWWKHYPKANIGWHPGPSGHLAMDLDKYKDEFDAAATGAIITREDEETLTSLTGGGGNHLAFTLPAGERFGSNRGGLPKGIDVRCWGGYIVLPPSNHKSGNRYQWETGYSPDEIVPAPLPSLLYNILKAAQQTTQATKIAIKSNLSKPDLTPWRLPAWLVDDLDNGQDANDRSTNDYRVMIALAERGLSDDDITAIWQHWPIGTDGKYADDGDRYLSMTLGKVRAKVGTPVGKYNGYQNGVKVGNAGGVDDLAADNGFGPVPAAKLDDEPSANGAQLPLVVELLRLTIDAGQDIDTLRDVVKKLSDQDKRDPLIIQQLRRVIVGEKRQSQETAIELWIRSCGNNRSSETETIITQLNRHGYDFRMNELDDSIETSGKILNDGLQAEIRCLMRDAKFKSMAAVADAYTMNAYHNRYHPIKDFLNALAWDGADHIAALAEHFTCSDTPVVYSDGITTSVIHAFLKRWLVGAVGKVYEQAQNVTLTMAGPQGIGKSFVAKWLCSPMRDFFNEGQLDPDGKETDRRLATTWIWEIGELGATTRRADVNALKNKLTQESVKFRVPYGHSDIIKPVLTSFIGTVNPDGRGFLIDKTGNRRFAVVNITAIDHGYSKTIDAAQIWAQAAALYRAGEPWRLTPEERATQEGINAEHTTEDALTMIMDALFHIDPADDNLRMSPFDVAHTLLMNNYAKDLDKCSKDAAAWLRAHGHEKKGRPLSWRGISAKLSGEIEQDRLDVKNSITRDAATSLGL